MADGTVEVVAEIFDDEFDDFLAILQKGSPMSTVDDIQYEIIDNADFQTDGFEIRY